MDTDFTPTLRRVLCELQALRASMDQQITVIQRVICSSSVRQRSGKQNTTKVRSPALVGYARHRYALLKHSGSHSGRNAG